RIAGGLRLRQGNRGDDAPFWTAPSCCLPPSRAALFDHRNPNLDARALAGGARQRDRAAKTLCPLPHGVQAHMPGEGFASVKAASVVGDRQGEVRALAIELEVDTGRAGVLDRVMQRL